MAPVNALMRIRRGKTRVAFHGQNLPTGLSCPKSKPGGFGGDC